MLDETMHKSTISFCVSGGDTNGKGISPCYRGKNGSLLSIGHKGRFLLVEILKGKMECKEQ